MWCVRREPGEPEAEGTARVAAVGPGFGEGGRGDCGREGGGGNVVERPEPSSPFTVPDGPSRPFGAVDRVRWWFCEPASPRPPGERCEAWLLEDDGGLMKAYETAGEDDQPDLVRRERPQSFVTSHQNEYRLLTRTARTLCERLV
jgi:hypothetical protein